MWTAKVQLHVARSGQDLSSSFTESFLIENNTFTRLKECYQTVQVCRLIRDFAVRICLNDLFSHGTCHI